MDRAIMMLAKAVKNAKDGVTYDVKSGAACPYCGQKTKVQTTKPWMGDCRIRYHKCENTRCALHVVDETIRSWQEA